MLLLILAALACWASGWVAYQLGHSVGVSEALTWRGEHDARREGLL